MTVEEVESALIDAVREVQSISGRSVDGIGPGSKPIGGLEGFDSINGVETGALVSERLGVDVGENPLVDENGKSLTLRAVAARIIKSRERI